MALPTSTLSTVANQVASFLRDSLDAANNNIDVRIGNPALPGDDGQHRLNLFFYRMEPSAFQAEGHPNDPYRMRLFCLITPFAIEDAEDADATIGAGENDLRLLGAVLRVFHEQPILAAVQAAAIPVRMQAVLLPMTDEQLNQVWSTQGDTAYRTSVVYEFSLFPVVPLERRPGALRVGALGLEARASDDRSTRFSGQVRAPVVPLTFVDVRDVAWTPLLAWFDGGLPLRTIAIDSDDPANAAFAAGLWIAGEPGVAVNLRWERWRDGFEPIGAVIAANVHTNAIDPDVPPTALANFPSSLDMPVQLAAGESSLQLLLYAERDVLRIDGSVQRVRSQPLLLTLYRGAP